MNRIGATSIAILKHCMEKCEFTFLYQIWENTRAVWKIYARFLIMEDPSSHSLPSKCSDYLNVWLDWINSSFILGKHKSLLTDVQVKVLEVIGHFLSAILLQQTALVYFSSFEKTDLLTRSSLLLLFFWFCITFYSKLIYI